MKSSLKVALIQSDLQWENTEDNLKSFSEKILQVDDDVDLIVLPEMFSTGFTMNVEGLAQNQDGATFSWMKEQAISSNSAIYGSFITEDDGEIYNRAYFFFPDGSFKKYDKKHLFTYAGEHKVFSAGKQRVIIEYKGWKIMPQICYDLRFPVWTRNDLNYDLLIYIASWPEKRKNHWNQLLKARAIENLTYVLAVNRVGVDGNDLTYSGNSQIIEYSGDVKCEAKEHKQEILSFVLNKDDQDAYRQNFGFLNDLDKIEFSSKL
jgi:predicted amidohydrolase